jgi:shikimate dehydrogenase
MTDRYGVIGHPIAHSKSPVIHAQFARETGEDISYEAFDIPPIELEARVKELVAGGILGLNVTVPHKQRIAELVDTLEPQAELAGAVNTVSVQPDGSLTGDNTDGTGLVRDLVRNLEVELAGIDILVLGAGGATRGIVPALLEAEPARLLIANRTPEKAEGLSLRFSDLGEVNACSFDELGGISFDLVINATSAGLQGEVPPFPESIISRGSVCYDLSYAMHDTPFVAWARTLHADDIHQGWGMLVEQAAESFKIWRGARPDTRPVRRRLPT